MPLLARRFSITNFVIASSALGFQIFVLYPWHTKLDEDFAELKRENLRLIQTVNARLSGTKETLSSNSDSDSTGLKALHNRPSPSP